MKNLAVSSSLLVQRKTRYGKFYNQYLKFYSQNLSKSKDELDVIQLSTLKNILLEVSDNTEYFNGIFNNKGITKELINSASSVTELISKLPIFQKDFLKKYKQEIDNLSRRRTYLSSTSGTTGTPNVISYDDESLQIGFALLRRFYDTIGLPKEFKSVRLSGKIVVLPSKNKPPFWIHNYSSKQLFMSVYHLTEKNIKAYIKKFNEYKPQLIDGYPSAIFVIAQYINKHKIKLQFKPIAIATTAETLYGCYKAEIEKAFGCKVYNQYSSSEGGPFIAECTHGKLHLQTDSGIFEFINALGKPAIAGEFAELVVTSFRQWKTPLIRYSTGDWVKISDKSFTYQSCDCGCNMPVIDEIIGREDDILFTLEKGHVGRLDPAYKGLIGIKKSKIIQHQIDFIEVVNIVDENYSEKVEHRLLKNLRDRLGEKINIEIKIVNEIPLGASGKFKAVERKFNLS